ncbi:MAG: ARPP-1 family domain-containing protein [Terriglobales bacterium]
MMWKTIAAMLLGGVLLAEAAPLPKYKVLDPIRQGDLTIYPVTSRESYDTSRFITLDEGLRSGEVVVTEAGRARPMIRRPRPVPLPDRGAEVNRLVLVNNSDRPLILLAGEIVTGGKQDRVVGRDRIVPPHSEPVDLSVFCVEPGRWMETSAQFGAFSAQMAQPSVRRRAMADRDQQQVWAEVRKSAGAMAAAAPAAARELANTSSYAVTMNNPQVETKVKQVAEPLARSYESLMKQLREQKAVGVVVAVRGRLLWADVFASQQLLEKYWPKLVRSYAAESITNTADTPLEKFDTANAQAYINQLWGEREISETDPDTYRVTEVHGAGYKVFRLTSLLPKTDFDVHLAKMTMGGEAVVGKMVR